MRLAQIGAQHEIDIINTNSYPGHHVLAPDAVLDCDNDLLILEQYGIRWSSRFHLIKRLSSTLAEPMVRILFQSGVDGLLATDTQKSLGEALLSIRIIQEIEDKANAGETDFTVSLSIYSRDIFFHIPFLIANHLNSQQRFAAAHRWYRFIFDPIATEPIPPGLPADEQLRRQRDRVWRYIEFRRNLDIPRVRDILTDPLAIEVYRKDPFNPACDRPATAKCLPKVHRHEGDRQPARLGDSLFAQFTREAVNETTMLYVMAADNSGRGRPKSANAARGPLSPRLTKNIKPLIRDSETLIELETVQWSASGARNNTGAPSSYRYAIDHGAIVDRDRARTIAEARRARRRWRRGLVSIPCWH